MHVEVIAERIERRFGVAMDLAPPHVPYRETITGSAEAEGKHKKQSGGRGQYGDCWIEVEPLPRGAGFEFVNKIVGGAIPRQFIPAVEKGVARGDARTASSPATRWSTCGSRSTTASTTPWTRRRWPSRSPARWG